MLQHSENVLFSTYLIPNNNPKPDEWWYYTTDHGQHISLYSRKSLEVLAKKFNKNFYSNGKNVHLLSGKKIPGAFFKLLTYPVIANYFAPISGKESLLDSDYKTVLENLKSRGT